jgi:uncharacterized membrane protein YhaH (DUF805 family)
VFSYKNSLGLFSFFSFFRRRSFFFVFLFWGIFFVSPVFSDDSCQDGEICLLEPFPADETPMKIEEGNRKGALFIMEQYVSRVYLFGSGFVSLIAVIWIIIGGYEIMFSGTSAGDISSGKDKIIKAIFGLMLVFLCALILHTINPQFFLR